MRQTQRARGVQRKLLASRTVRHDLYSTGTTEVRRVREKVKKQVETETSICKVLEARKNKRTGRLHLEEMVLEPMMAPRSLC